MAQLRKETMNTMILDYFMLFIALERIFSASSFIFFSYTYISFATYIYSFFKSIVNCSQLFLKWLNCAQIKFLVFTKSEIIN